MTTKVKGGTSIGIGYEYAIGATLPPILLTPLAVLAWVLGPGWARHAPVAAVVGYLAAVVILTVGWTARFWSIALHFDDQGLTAQNFWRRHRLAWQDVAALKDGFRVGSNSGSHWALDIVARDGRVITARATSYRRKDEIPQLLAEIRGIARPHRISVQITGDPYGEWVARWTR